MTVGAPILETVMAAMREAYDERGVRNDADG